jgi:hypothetical protein
MKSKISRRLLLNTVLASPVLGLTVARAFAAEPTPLDPNDPTAKALGFALDSTKVDAATNATHKPEQRCGTCAQFTGKPGDKTGGCNIFVGHTVPATGWCKVWAQKPA